MTDPVRTSTRSSRRRGLVAVLALAAATGLTLVSTAPAQAAVVTTRYAFTSSGYGTRATAAQVGLSSAPTSYSVLGCTRATGIRRANWLAATDLTSQLRVGAVSTEQVTYATSAGDAVTRSTSTVARVTLGSDLLGLRITGLRGVSKAWATKGGRLRASSDFTFSSIQPVGPVPLPYPLDQPADVVLSQLATRGPVTIPGLGIIRLGERVAGSTATWARGSGTGLEVHLFGADRLPGTGDDSNVVLVRTYARVTSLATRGVFTGGPWGVDASAVGGIATLGRNPYSPIPCEGTGGQVRSASLAGLDLASRDQLVVHGLRNRLYGKQGVPRRGQTGWAESTLTDLSLAGGQVRVGAVRALAKVVRSARGRITPSSVQSIGSITVNGTSRPVPQPGQAIEVPGVARIEAPRPVRSTFGIRVTALRITLLGGTAAGSVVNLGNAEIYARGR